MKPIEFTRHAKEKFSLLERFGFKIFESDVVAAVEHPEKIERRELQIFSTKIIDDKLALRVVSTERKGIILVITFYPVRRERYGL